MAQFSETVDIKRPPEEVWRAVGQPERWFEGYLETRSRSPDDPAPDTRNDHLYRTHEGGAGGAGHSLRGAHSARGDPAGQDLCSQGALQPDPQSPTGRSCG